MKGVYFLLVCKIQQNLHLNLLQQQQEEMCSKVIKTVSLKL